MDAFYNRVNYTYVKDGDSRQTGLVSQVTSEVRVNSDTELLSGTTYCYTYDDNGNITKITDAGGVIQNRYYYDSLGQLYREDNRGKNETYFYTYDEAGNIIIKLVYPFTISGLLGNFKSRYVYSYTDSSWGDLLTDAYGKQ